MSICQTEIKYKAEDKITVPESKLKAFDLLELRSASFREIS